MATILVISPTPSHPQDAGNRARIFSLLSALKTAGHKVHFAFVASETGDDAAMIEAWDGYYPLSYRRPADRWMKRKFDNWAQKFGRLDMLPYRIDDWYTPELTMQLQQIRDRVQPDVVLVEYVFMSRAFECFGSGALKMLDTHDIFGDRHRIYQKNGMKPQWFYTTLKEEKKALDRADVVIAIQVDETKYFAQQTNRPVITVGHLVKDPSPDKSTEQSNRLLFVGSGNPINVEALHWFISEVFPLLRQNVPDVELEIVGKCARRITAENGLILTGQVEDLTPYYRRAKVVVNPVRFGTGLKIKTIEALSMGKPLVTTSHGCSGLESWAGKAFLVADTPEDISSAICQILNSSTLAHKLKGQAVVLIDKYNAEALAPLSEVISSSEKNGEGMDQ